MCIRDRVAGVPRVMGVRELLEEWVAFRVECVRRRTHYDMSRKMCIRDRNRCPYF